MKNLIAFTLAVLLMAQSSFATGLQTLAEGMPDISKDIGVHSFVPVELEQLKNAKVWYVDYNWHREQGIDVPQDGIKNENFVRELLQAYAYQSRGDGDNDGDFTGKKKLAYADYYGGMGAGTNHGSGRAAAFGKVQIKGTKTSLAKSTDAWHSNGAVQSIEAVDEAIWSQILDAEFKFGSNKVVAVIVTGTYGVMKDGTQKFPRALIIREMAVRPAHYMLSPARQYWSTPGDGTSDTVRVKKSLQGLLTNLPYPAGFKTADPKIQLRTGIFELVHREALAQAEYVAQRIFFGSYSPSNMEITGRRLDLGDHTAQAGYSPIYRVDHIKHTPFGGTKAFLDIFQEFRKSLISTLEPALLPAVPTAKEINEAFEKDFIKNRSIELVRLSGVPHEILADLKEDAKVQRLGEVLWQVSQIGQPEQPILADPNGWQNTSRYDINSILISLGKNRVSDLVSVQKVIDSLITDKNISDELSRTYAEFLFAVQTKVRGQISLKGLQTYMAEASERRNLTRETVIRGHKRWRQLWDTTDLGIGPTADPLLIQNYIEDMVAKNRTNYKDAKPFTVVLQEKMNSAEGSTLREVFDAKNNSYKTELRIHIQNGVAVFNGQKYTAEQLKHLAQGELNKDTFIATLPATADLKNDAIHFEQLLRTTNLGVTTKMCMGLFK